MSPAHWVQAAVLAVVLGGCLGVLTGAAVLALRPHVRRIFGTRQEREALATAWMRRDARLRRDARPAGHRNRKRTHP